MTREETLYQVKLIIECLPENEYKLIPKETIEYIEKNYKYNEEITIDPNIPLDEQNLDYRTCEVLERIINKVDKWETIDLLTENDSNSKNIKLERIMETLKKEKEKVEEARTLCEDYQNLIDQKDILINELQEFNKKLKLENENLTESISKLPKILRKFFFRNNGRKLLIDK